MFSWPPLPWLLLTACQPAAPGLNLGLAELHLTVPPGPVERPQQIPLGTWESMPPELDAEGEPKCHRWQTQLPVQVPVDFSTGRRPRRMFLRGQSTPKWDTKLAPETWRIAGEKLQVCLRQQEQPKDWTLEDPLSVDRERRLNHQLSGLLPLEFVTGSIPDGDRQHRGLYLPAPAQAAIEVLVPKGGVLGMDLGLLTAPINAGRSDGATLHVEVEHGGARVRVASLRAGPGEALRAERVALDDWAGQHITLHLISDPGADAQQDYLMLREPALYTPSRNPRRVVLVFIDTLRPDHMGVYGYERDTTPAIDAWARSARVYTQAHSVAPWTLPSARAALSGQMPERWDPETALPADLRAGGYLAHGLLGNAFLSPGFDMGTGWSGYELAFLPQAGAQVDRALEIMEQWPDRDVALMVHFMDPHMPYREPESHQVLWARERPELLEHVGLGRDGLRRLSRKIQKDAAAKQYLLDRYDQNIRWVDDSLERLFDALPKSAWVALFSDHGEEFWEHGGVEHGHSLEEELLHVPLIISGPGVTTGVQDSAVSLLDLSPTLRGLLGLTARETQGRDLRAPWTEQPLGLGYTLYGPDAWGVLAKNQKLVLTQGQATVHHKDGQQTQADPKEWTQAAEQAFGRPLVQVWRIFMPVKQDKRMPYKLKVELVFDQAQVTDSWSAYDPLSILVEPSSSLGSVTLDSRAGGIAPREWYVQTLPALAPGVIKVDSGRQSETRFDVDQGPVKAGSAARKLTIQSAWAIAPPAAPIAEVPQEMEQMLKAAGYLE